MTSDAAGRRGSGWIPWVFAGAFGLVVAANGALVYLATSTFNGLVTENAYQEGVAFNRMLERADDQARTAWSVEPSFSAKGGMTGELTLVVATRDGAPLTGAVATVRFVRPIQEGYDFDASLASRGDGRYGATVTFPLPGLWDAHVTIERDGRVHGLVRRLVVR
ncbi:MAG: FixH family protein [Alphaproteobacteria bacterium]